jgi:glycosyltransferase involved in cell wall biosynthesis
MAETNSLERSTGDGQQARDGALRILWLVPYNPWPRHHGGKLRTWALIIGAAAERSEITVLYANEDGTPPPPPVPRVTWREYVPRPRRTLPAKLRSVFSAYPEAAWVGWNAAADQWIRDHAHEFDIAVLEQAHMAIFKSAVSGIPRLVLDAQNVEHRLVRQLAARQPRFRTRARYLLDAAKFARIERRLFRRADLVTACSELDAEQITAISPGAQVVVRPNGVDLQEFRYQDPTDDLPTNVVMTGTLGYLPNLDAARWIHDDIWPRIRSEVPQAAMFLVGASCPPDLAALDSPADGFNVVGFVDDVRPSLRTARVFLMPLRAGSGTRLKALQAMAAGCPIVSTAQGVEGLGADASSVRVRETAEEIADDVVTLLLDERLRVEQARNARAFVEETFGWERIAADLRDDFEALRARPHR